MYIFFAFIPCLIVFLRLSTHNKHEGKRERRQQRGDKNVLQYFSIFKQGGNIKQNLQTLVL